MTDKTPFDFGLELTELVIKAIHEQTEMGSIEHAKAVAQVVQELANNLGCVIGVNSGGDPARASRLLEAATEYMHERAGLGHKVVLGVNDGSIRTVWVPDNGERQ